MHVHNVISGDLWIDMGTQRVGAHHGRDCSSSTERPSASGGKVTGRFETRRREVATVSGSAVGDVVTRSPGTSIGDARPEVLRSGG